MTYQQEYYQKNKEKVRARNRAWAAANKEKMAGYLRSHKAKPVVKQKLATASKKWKDANPERRKQYCREWRANNPERARAHCRNRDALKRHAEGVHTDADVLEIFTLQKGRCAYCRCDLKQYHVDHIKPLAHGGDNFRRNLQLLCPGCNSRKSDTDPLVFARKIGYLL